MSQGGVQSQPPSESSIGSGGSPGNRRHQSAISAGKFGSAGASSARCLCGVSR